MINEKRQWQLLEKIGFSRVGGSKEEKKAALILKETIEKTNNEALIEEFEVDWQKIKAASLKTAKREYQVTAYYQCENTDEEGLTAPFYYFSTDSAVGIKKCEGKIVLINGYLRMKTYEKLLEGKAVGFITFSGELKDAKEDTDLESRELRSPQREKGNLPGVHMTVHDAMELVLENPQEVTLNVQQDTFKINSQNVVAQIKGENNNEIVVFTAHYDSVQFSSGVYDNGAGSVILMELYHYFLANKPKRTIRFVWCGSEERGLLGSIHHVKNNKDLIENIILNINVDVAGPVLGSDVAVVTGPESLVHYIDYLAKEKGFEIKVKQDIYSSDNMPFAYKGIPTVSFARFGGSGQAYIHDRYDQLFFMDSKNLKRTAEFVRIFAERMINSYVFPVPREMPENMVEKVTEYLNDKMTEE
ncbi:MAG: M28 family peptidase [Bacillota bacterium]|nr:M28 family peptidase [Bacillota bacterium]NLL26504.1 Zn-dependent exopeptidase M28 [Erysipelotrichia bacterium]